MQLRGQESVRRNFIRGAIASTTRTASYDVSVGTVIATDDNQIAHEYTREFAIEPQKMCVIVSKETVHVPDGFVAYALPKTSLCRRGLLTLNTGIVDPGYDGLISTTAINFSLKPIEIRSGDAFLRIVFHELKPDTASAPPEHDCPTEHEYLKSRRAEATQYPRAFLDIPGHLRRLSSQIKNETLAAVVGRFQWYVALIAVIFTAGNFWLNMSAKSEAKAAGTRYVSEVRDITTAAAINTAAAQNLSGTLHQQAASIAAVAAQLDTLKAAKFASASELGNLQLRLQNLELVEKDMEHRVNALEVKSSVR
jgi:deoxycytidine triphosphate deaminase